MAARKNTSRKLPDVPKEAFSVLGPLPVAPVKNLESKQGCLGHVDFQQRKVQLESGAGRKSQLQTFWHESAHIAMWDGGCCDSLTEAQEEAVCNALGTYLAAAHIAGYITVPPKLTPIP